MKRFLLVFGLLTATCTFTSIRHASAQTVTAASFTAQITTLDAQITSGDTISANATFAAINSSMIRVLGATKTSIHNATNTTDKDYYTNYLTVQQLPLYRAIWSMKTNLTLNHSAVITKLNAFDALIY